MARIVMAPGWEAKLKLATAGPIFRTARDMAEDVRGNIRQDKLVESGTLVRSVRVRRRANGDARVSIGTDHWMPLEYGARPHMMVAPPGQVIRFVKANGEVVFTKWVRHPGNRAYRFVRRAAFKKRVVR